MEEDYILAYEYEKNVNPPLNNIPFYEKNIDNSERIPMQPIKNIRNLFCKSFIIL